MRPEPRLLEMAHHGEFSKKMLKIAAMSIAHGYTEPRATKDHSQPKGLHYAVHRTRAAIC